MRDSEHPMMQTQPSNSGLPQDIGLYVVTSRDKQIKVIFTIYLAFSFPLITMQSKKYHSALHTSAKRNSAGVL